MADGYGQRPQGSTALKNLAAAVAIGSEGVADLAIWHGFLEPSQKTVEPLSLPARLVSQVPHTGLAPLGLLNVGPPQPFLGPGVPLEVEIVQPLIVGKEDDLALELRPSRRQERPVQLGEQGLPLRLPVLVDDHGREVDMNLVARCDEVVNGGDPLQHRRGAHIDHLGDRIRHKAETDAGTACDCRRENLPQTPYRWVSDGSPHYRTEREWCGKARLPAALSNIVSHLRSLGGAHYISNDRYRF